MNASSVLLPIGVLADLTTCDREPIHTPGSIQPHGALLVADMHDLRISHISANLPAGLLGRTIAEVLGTETVGAVQAALREEGHSFSHICSATLPTPEQPRCDVVAHRLGERFYIEFEPSAENDANATVLPEGQAVIQSLRRTHSRQELCEVAVRELKALTGFDRVMAYHFDDAGNGKVIAEAHEPDLDPFLDLRFPASDIPEQARRLYLLQRVRSLVDVDYAPVPLLTDAAGPGAAPLDMTFCHLRGISPLHIEYLRNMGVGATLAISLIPDNALWGMLIFHHRGPRRISAQLRSLCDLVGQIMSLLIGAKGQNELLAERLSRTTTLNSIGQRASTTTSMAALLEKPEEVLNLLKAEGALIQIGGQPQLIGRTPDLPEARAIAAAMRTRSAGEVTATEALGSIYPEFASLAATASGVLNLPILHGPEDGITWFREEVTRTVSWGGNPEKAMSNEGGRLTPRKSFAAWRDILQGHSRSWKEVDVELANDLRRLITGAMLRHLETQTRLANLRHYDALTGLPNRRLVQERLEARASDPTPSPAAMIFLDLDRFKTVNDTLGHALGDDLLIQVANRLVNSVPADHLVARLGGDEFVILCENTSLVAAQEVADAVIAVFRTPFQLAGKPYRLSTSVGVALAGLERTDDMLRSADSAMYAAKREGGNRAVTFDATLHDAVLLKLELEQDLYHALEQDELELHYQPLVRLHSGEIFGFEALLRWHHPERGLVSPADFIPLAEETGLIVPIGSWVLRQAVHQLRAWREKHGRDIFVSVNVSAQQTARPDFAAEVAAVLADAGLPPHALLLEVTESILTEKAAVNHLNAIRQTGVRIAIDDFGTGYSSLAYLQQLPVDELKIDKLFVARLGQDPRQSAFVGALIQLAHTLSLDVIAEGIEHEQQWTELRALGCNAAQGYWIGRPVPPELAEEVLCRGCISGVCVP
jgi:diguanylate cyclase (GGDEF)-like protein